MSCESQGASQISGQVEMLFDGENEQTFQAEDALSLGERIVRVMEDPALRRRLAQAGRQMVLKRFTLDRIVANIEQWLQEIAGQPV